MEQSQEADTQQEQRNTHGAEHNNHEARNTQI